VADYNGQQQFPLFTESYQKFKNILETGQVVYITAIYQPKWNSDEYQLTIKEVRQLDAVGKELTESITLKLPLDDITNELMNKIETLCEEYKGKHKLKIALVDLKNMESLNFTSKNKFVNADSDFARQLDKLGVKYRFN